MAYDDVDSECWVCHNSLIDLSQSDAHLPPPPPPFSFGCKHDICYGCRLGITQERVELFCMRPAWCRKCWCSAKKPTFFADSQSGEKIIAALPYESQTIPPILTLAAAPPCEPFSPTAVPSHDILLIFAAELAPVWLPVHLREEYVRLLRSEQDLIWNRLYATDEFHGHKKTRSLSYFINMRLYDVFDGVTAGPGWRAAQAYLRDFEHDLARGGAGVALARHIGACEDSLRAWFDLPGDCKVSRSLTNERLDEEGGEIVAYLTILGSAVAGLVSEMLSPSGGVVSEAVARVGVAAPNGLQPGWWTPPSVPISTFQFR